MGTVSLVAAAVRDILVIITSHGITSAQSIGVCYGQVANNLPPESEVINLYHSNGIGKIRIYNSNHSVLDALRLSNRELIVGVANEDLQSIANCATDWVQRNILSYVPDVKFKYIAVGNEIKPRDAESAYVLPAMQNIYNELVAANLQTQIKVSTAIDLSLLGSSYPPSSGSFIATAAPYINPIIGVVVRDGQFGYQNLFGAIVDTLYYAVEKAGGPNVEIVVSESGWPSEGGEAATVDNASTYLRNLIANVGWGTPRKPGKAIETYLFGMFDENQKGPAESQRHFGLFSPDKVPKYIFD
ncbi:hypothetical protein FEM48_Zijuj02G0190900 [Ziziphus jujuba var. spinosa]|uniref:glucan endo-1,3-beta-D-glucosidase n=1 Tax=Ziziphus jujuba var. spinosa TaxID=714518 RepID=A0A978VXF7_ZIZJJ|nr:hypothetical protein FEM48_Zijuj02G0190900 [Ziziphus jujuba var. spinosa]